MIPKDEFGPEYVLRVYDPKIEMEGFLVIDNTVLGPGKGGVRMTPDVTEEEIFRLARTMTWKNALVGIPFGGAKAGIIWNGNDLGLKKRYVQSFARMLKPFLPQKYIAGPDINTGEKEMRWFVEAVRNKLAATGKPFKLSGLPHELGSTGFGVSHATVVAAELLGMDIKNSTIAIDGFGNVGSFAFKFLKQFGAKVIAVSDSRGTAFSEKGFDAEALIKLKRQGKSVIDYPFAAKMARDEIFKLAVDILIPASVTDVINEKNEDAIKAKIIVEGANIPMREDVEERLFRRGILIVPDFVANAGGVISSYAEYKGYTPDMMFKLVERKIKAAAKSVLTESIKRRENPRKIALAIAKAKLQNYKK